MLWRRTRGEASLNILLDRSTGFMYVVSFTSRRLGSSRRCLLSRSFCGFLSQFELFRTERITCLRQVLLFYHLARSTVAIPPYLMVTLHPFLDDFLHWRTRWTHRSTTLCRACGHTAHALRPSSRQFLTFRSLMSTIVDVPHRYRPKMYFIYLFNKCRYCIF